MTTWVARGVFRFKCEICGKFRKAADIYLCGHHYSQVEERCMWCMDTEQRIIAFSRDNEGRKLVEDILQRKRDSVLGRNQS